MGFMKPETPPPPPKPTPPPPPAKVEGPDDEAVQVAIKRAKQNKDRVTRKKLRIPLGGASGGSNGLSIS